MYRYVRSLFSLSSQATQITKPRRARRLLTVENMEDRRMLATLTVTMLVENGGVQAENDGEITLREAIR